MNGLPLDPEDGGDRFPGFDVLEFRAHWDDATRSVVDGRLGMLPAIRFFSVVEEAAATALFDQLLYQRSEPKVPVTRMVDSRLAEKETDGWHYDTMPPDDVAWRRSLASLDEDARGQHGVPFCECSWDDQTELLSWVHASKADEWHGLPPAQVWSLWTRYACTAFYSHPWAWNEIGFAGPAYPRGYKNIGVDRREPFEVADTSPGEDPVRDAPDAR
ncbi:gluconate 2-dehydrogenase subunit 3 family protein [Diaminobutyricibacter sp. McL0608]|uniref:gluconate 2-dehydrogenase subunit 3 family protein n=1 Tax=Leifsonia sp. McL0608 TaxID=3143537 RepID=UPI0031F2F606